MLEIESYWRLRASAPWTQSHLHFEQIFNTSNPIEAFKCEINDNRFRQLLFTYLSTHVSRSIAQLFVNLLVQQVAFWSQFERRTRPTMKNLICGISGTGVTNSRMINGIVITHCQFARNSPREVSTSPYTNIVFLNRIEDLRNESDVSVVCIAENYSGTIPGKMIVKIEEEDMTFLLDVFGVCIGQTGQIRFAQQFNIGGTQNLILVPKDTAYQTLVIRAPTPQVVKQYYDLLQSAMQLVLDESGVKEIMVIPGGGMPEIMISKYLSDLSQSFLGNSYVTYTTYFEH